MSRSAINNIVFECVDSALASFESIDKTTFYEHLKKNYGVRQEEFADRFQEIHDALRDVYGLNHFKIERSIIRILNERAREGIYNRADEVPAFGYIVNVFMKETEKSIEKTKEINTISTYAKHLEEKVKEQNERLKAAERFVAIGETAAMVGHDIRNPLQAIVGELYLQKGDVESLPDSPAKAGLRESIRNVEENLFYINKIVSDLQDFAKPLKPEEEDVDVDTVIADVLCLIPIPSSLQVQINVEDGFPLVIANNQMLKRAMTNLVMNAVQAMSKGGKLTITAKRLDGQAEIAVQDSGEGIPDEVKARLFKPLVTTKSKGQGLGLAVVKRLVEAMGGKVGFESENGQGAKFYIRLPIKPERRKR